MKRILLLLGTLLAVALVLEVILQLGHLAVALSRRSAPTLQRDGSGTSVLCVGDSHTFGIGASSAEASYPARLEARLRRDLDPDARVVNAGWPGQNSYELLSTLDDQLAETHPDYVVILIGANDAWSRPRRWTEGDRTRGSRSGAWRLEWRTGRLIRLASNRLPWRRALLPAPGGEAPAARENGQLALSADPVGEGWRLLRSREYRAALAVAESGMVDGTDQAVQLSRIKVRTLVNLGRRAEAADLTLELGRRYEQQPSAQTAETFLDALDRTGQRLESLELARDLTGTYPELALPWQVIGWRAYEDGHRVTAISAFEACLQRHSTDNPRWMAGAMRQLAGALEDDDPPRSVNLLLQAALLDGEATVSAGLLALNLGEADAESLLRHHLDTSDLTPEEIAVGEQISNLLHEDLWSISEHNLQQIIRKTLLHGATPIVLSYPFCHQETLEIHRTVGVGLGAVWVDLCTGFREQIESGASWETLFIADGHCTDAGYAVLSDLVAEAILGLDE